MKIPKTIYSVKSNILFIGGLVAFVIFFTFVYKPNYGLSESLIYGDKVISLLWYSHQATCLPICGAIILMVTAISRTLLLITTHTARIHEKEYLAWQFGEVTATALFCELFLSLYLHISYLKYLPIILLIYISVAIFPYAFYWLLVERIDRDMRIAEAQRTILRLRQAGERNANDILRFTDEKGTVRLIVSIDRVVYVEADGNYVNILYENNGKLTRYTLRNTLKAIEGLNDNLVRCHRSYYLNLKNIKLLRKAPDGIYAEMNAEGVQDIPISKSYAANVIDRFTETI